ncbi:hypothetical protein NDU88_003144 [Pleurodeles waltl]|uniref:Uncharacterized protein n=1 Tax=Pleurodeles waltl TaxID=8319 RepID=A0AAV7NH97_PLEWA|nr:hypothetical protein NDU88_003144 [Pleurodeles waltl]
MVRGREWKWAWAAEMPWAGSTVGARWTMPRVVDGETTHLILFLEEATKQGVPALTEGAKPFRNGGRNHQQKGKT